MCHRITTLVLMRKICNVKKIHSSVPYFLVIKTVLDFELTVQAIILLCSVGVSLGGDGGEFSNVSAFDYELDDSAVASAYCYVSVGVDSANASSEGVS
ncbi:hypothetical protein QVD17_00451 [Tagetes erecta]|uniref:Uncharacterized protein n=1 Tax=Tagetes erecta TaxID=13708 RepID=A0AAD8P782_TARER|nr:hypothetical protein QVD17_00451 [Tagetes erecta]